MKPSDLVNYTFDVPLKQLTDAVESMLRVQMENMGMVRDDHLSEQLKGS